VCFGVFFCVHDTAATRGQYLALSKAALSSSHYLSSCIVESVSISPPSDVGVGAPRNFEGEVRSANSIQLSWTEPLEAGRPGGGGIDSYELYYNDTHFRQNVRVTVPPAYHTYLLTDLTPATVYHLRLAARTSRGHGPSTDTIQLQTLDYGQQAYLLVKSKSKVRLY